MTKRAVKPRKPPAAKVDEDVASSYRIDFSVTASLCPEEDTDAITTITANIVHVGEEGDRSDVVGTLVGWCIRWSCIQKDDYDFIDGCDAHGQPDLCEIASLVWDFDAQNYQAGLADEFGGDLIIPHAVSLVPEHRGKGVGLLVVARFLDYFGGSAALAALKPYPLNYGLRDEPPDHAFKKMYGQFAQTSEADGTAKLAKHWSKLGFRRLHNTGIFVLNMCRPHPTLDDLIKGCKEKR